LAMLNNLKITYFNYLPVLFFNLPDKFDDPLQTPFYSYRMAMTFNPNNYKTDIEKINVPTIVLAGDKDESFYVNQFKSVFAESKYSKVDIIPQAKHLDILHSNQAQAAILTYFRGVN
ncbi:MAG: alpha/beta hydrolase, partial [Cytophagales bacterium]|nr:alpha/beta hydrolase [Cytophagales bacterium]